MVGIGDLVAPETSRPVSRIIEDIIDPEGGKELTSVGYTQAGAAFCKGIAKSLR